MNHTVSANKNSTVIVTMVKIDCHTVIFHVIFQGHKLETLNAPTLNKDITYKKNYILPSFHQLTEIQLRRRK